MKKGNEIGDSHANQRLSPGEFNALDCHSSAKPRRQAAQLFHGQKIAVPEFGYAFGGHAVATTEIASVRHGDAE
jgi:hypothetical protein